MHCVHRKTEAYLDELICDKAGMALRTAGGLTHSQQRFAGPDSSIASHTLEPRTTYCTADVSQAGKGAEASRSPSMLDVLASVE